MNPIINWIARRISRRLESWWRGRDDGGPGNYVRLGNANHAAVPLVLALLIAGGFGFLYIMMYRQASQTGDWPAFREPETLAILGGAVVAALVLLVIAARMTWAVELHSDHLIVIRGVGGQIYQPTDVLFIDFREGQRRLDARLLQKAGNEVTILLGLDGRKSLEFLAGRQRAVRAMDMAQRWKRA